VPALDVLHPFVLSFARLPPWVRFAAFVGAGLSLLALAVPKFEYEFVTALLYMLLAVLLFWMALAVVM